MRTLKIALAAAVLASASVAQADELLLTTGNAKRGGSVAVDYVSDGRASGLEIHIKLPDGGEADLSRFGTNLPKGFSLHTNVVKGKLIALVVSDTNQLLPAGVIPLGVVSSKNGSGSFALEQVVAADPVGQVIQVTSTANDANK